MKKIRERTYAKRLLTFIAGLIVGWILYIFVFAIINGDDPISDTQGMLAGLFSLITMIAYQLIAEYNYLKRLELTTASLHSNISVFKDRESKLLSKAENFVLKFLNHESDIQKSVASLRGGSSTNFVNEETLSSLNGLKVTVENYPELKGDKHISKILDQLEESQNTILNSKLLFNEYVTYYNSAIVSFPAVLLSGLWKLKPLQFYVDNDIDEI
jgi:LemA protein